MIAAVENTVSRTDSPTGRKGGVPARSSVALHIAGASPEKPMAKMTYGEQLRHPNWQKRRLEILKRDDFKCQVCYDGESTLHVHHRRYVKGRMVWEYEDDELVTLCLNCHESMHEQNDTLAQLFARLPMDGPFCGGEAISLLAGWASRGGRVDLEGLSAVEEGGFSHYMFALGEVIALLDVFNWRLDHVNALRHLLLGASRDEIGEAIVEMLHKLQK